VNCIRCLVEGRVQGVFFRAATKQEADRLGIAGHAVNLPDGRVEVVARGTEDALGRLRRFLHEGPPQASVTAVSCAPWHADSVRDGFRTG
jgi:acylphosphatase